MRTNMKQTITWRPYIAIAMAGAALGWFGIPSIAQSGDTYKITRLSALPADAKTRADMAGSGSVTGVLAGTKFTINGTFEGLKTNAVAAKLHAAVSPAAGVRGPEIADLTISKATSGTITGSVMLTAAQIDNLKKGGLYVQIYSEKPTDGTLWGWFLK